MYEFGFVFDVSAGTADASDLSNRGAIDSKDYGKVPFSRRFVSISSSRHLGSPLFIGFDTALLANVREIEGRRPARGHCTASHTESADS